MTATARPTVAATLAAYGGETASGSLSRIVGSSARLGH